jgi:hypothetical protein
MMNATTAPQNEELARLEILRKFKRHFGGKDENRNISPFTLDRVIRYSTDVRDCDVPEIHREARGLIQETIAGIRQGHPSQVVILAGQPGMGKSHLINYFRSADLAEKLGYVLVCNSNHWKVDEFEECLLNWILDALVRPSPAGPHLLLEKIQDLAFEAFGQILAQPGQMAQFKAKGPSGLLGRLWAKIRGSDQEWYQKRVERRDTKVFHLLNFPKFSGRVCDRFLHESGNPFHRYVLHVLLRYLFEGDRETVLHWLGRKEVRHHFLKQLGALDQIDRHFKVMDTIKILISLFTLDVVRNLGPRNDTANRDRVFFFAFDQVEGRNALFDNESDWLRFFAQLSELYNTLPNVFILFTMTNNQRNQLYPKMEAQFQERIRRDQRFVLHEIEDDEILLLYKRRMDKWLADAPPEVRESPLYARNPFLPFTQEEVLDFSRKKTLRQILEEFDLRFRKYLVDIPSEDPRYDYRVSQNELREEEQNADNLYQYTENHLETVKQFLEQGGEALPRMAGVSLAKVEWEKTDTIPAVLRMEFKDLEETGRWVRVFLVRLPFRYGQLIDPCVNLLYGLTKDRNLLWLLRSKGIPGEVETKKPGQIFANELPGSVQTNLQAMLRLLESRDKYPQSVWADAEGFLFEELKLTYLGELLHEVSQALERQQDKETGKGAGPLASSKETAEPDVVAPSKAGKKA